MKMQYFDILAILFISANSLNSDMYVSYVLESQSAKIVAS